MTAIDQHIKALLYDHDCVIIPGFGGLIAQYTPARIHPVRHTFTPPSKKIAFNEKLHLNDGLLISWVARHENMSPEASAQQVAAFVNQVRLALQQHNRYQLDEIGLFRRNAEQQLEFEYFEKLNLLAESFGLPEFTVKPVQYQQALKELRATLQERNLVPMAAESAPTGKRSRWRKALRYAAILPIAALTASAIYLASDSQLSLSSLSPFGYLATEEKAAQQPVPEPATAAYVAPAAPALTEDYASPALPDTSAAAATASDWDTPAETAPTAEAFVEASNPETPAATAPAVAAPAPEAAKPAAPALSQPKPANEEKKAAPTVIKVKTGRYYIIAGGFADPANARQLHQEASAAGLASHIIAPGHGSRLHRVSLADFETEAEADKQIIHFKKTYGNAIWVLAY